MNSILIAFLLFQDFFAFIDLLHMHVLFHLDTILCEVFHFEDMLERLSWCRIVPIRLELGFFLIFELFAIRLLLHLNPQESLVL